jgi:3-deoxy-manno-octulosonate cytidylyltransferase (CMP-KDO synthetase)
MSAAIIIPARYASTRLPGKPMIRIAGTSLLERVWRIAKAVKSCSSVIISTEDERVALHARSFGGHVVLTSQTCKNGTERTYETLAVANVQEEFVINFQGDAVLTPPWVLESLIDEFYNSPPFDIVTPAVALTSTALEQLRVHKRDAPSSGTTVTFDRQRNALYFSKQVIPYLRNADIVPVYRHIGIYGYSRGGLERFVSLSQTPLEQAEGLEQLRALEHGMKVRIVVVDYKGRTHASVDAPEDVQAVEALIAAQGELLVEH